MESLKIILFLLFYNLLWSFLFSLILNTKVGEEYTSEIC